jgi:membrane-associated phospholipid phosphatase
MSLALCVASRHARADEELPSATAPANQLPLHPAAANPPRNPKDLSDETFKFRLAIDLPVTLAAAGTWIVLGALKNQLSSTCHWCEYNADGTDGVNGFDQGARTAFKWSNTAAAGTISDVTVFAVIPAFAVGMDLLSAGSPRRWQRFGVDFIMMAEAATVSGALVYAAKYGAARERPYAHYEHLSGVPFKANIDDNASFFSGHATFAFSVATSAGTIASLRHYRLAPVIWAVGMTLATFGGYLRVAADKHYLSDVMTGALVGSAVGVAVPLTHWIRPLRERKINIGGGGDKNGGIVTISGAF